MAKYFLHRIQKDNGSFVKGIEVHDTPDSAILSYHGRMKLAYGKSPLTTFVSCQITDESGNIVGNYNETWNTEYGENVFFVHYIRRDGQTYTKNIDLCLSIEDAKASMHAQMEYGYGNPNHSSVSFVSCMITDQLSGGMVLLTETWNRAETQA